MRLVRQLFGSSLALIALALSGQSIAIERISVSSTGLQGNDESRYPSISADGQFIAYRSYASNLVADDTNDVTTGTTGTVHSAEDMFVYNRNNGTTERVSISSTEQQSEPRGVSYYHQPVISDEGRHVAFTLSSYNLVEDPGSSTGLYVRDREAGTTEIVNISTAGKRPNRGTYDIDISSNGRYVVFSSNATNLFRVANGNIQVYIRDRLLNRTELVSRSATGEPGLAGSRHPSVSANGQIIAFESSSFEIADYQNSDPAKATGIFVSDQQSGTIEMISTGYGTSRNPVLTPDGRYVVFSSARGIVVHDRSSGTGIPVAPIGIHPSISLNGRFVVFGAGDSNLVNGDTNGFSDIFVHDRTRGLTERVSLSNSGQQANHSSFEPSISVDGQYIVFTSQASNLVEGDTNSERDIFLTENPLFTGKNDLILVEKLINNEKRETQDLAAKLSTGTLYRQSYKVTNNSPNRLYQVRVFENGNMVCNFYTLDPGQTRQRCDTFNTVLDGEQHVQVNVSAKVSGSGEVFSSSTDAYYTGLNDSGELRVTHRINNINADSPDQAQTLGSSQSTVSYKVENTGEIELYQVKTYHDPVSPLNSGWALQCVLGPLKPGQIRYCKRDINLSETGLNQAMGRVQGRNAIRSATEVVNASNPTYFIVP